jgi:hypothetical protein
MKRLFYFKYELTSNVFRATGSRASYERRFYETNLNGCCGVIAPYQCRQRDHIDPTNFSSPKFCFPISFHDSRERESFLQYIDHLISTSTSPEATSCLSNMRGWILSNFRPGMPYGQYNYSPAGQFGIMEN